MTLRAPGGQARVGCIDRVTVDVNGVAAVTDDVRWWQNGNPMDDPRAMKLRGLVPSK